VKPSMECILSWYRMDSIVICYGSGGWRLRFNLMKAGLTRSMPPDKGCLVVSVLTNAMSTIRSCSSTGPAMDFISSYRSTWGRRAFYGTSWSRMCCSQRSR
jgi:hypothetical protein